MRLFDDFGQSTLNKSNVQISVHTNFVEEFEFLDSDSVEIQILLEAIGCSKSILTLT